MRTIASIRNVRRIPGALALVFFLAAGRSFAGPEAVAFHVASQPQLKGQRFDVHTVDGLTHLIATAEGLIEVSERQEQQYREAREQARAGRPLAEMLRPELVSYFTEAEDVITRRDRRGLRAIQQFARAALETHAPEKREELAAGLVEISAAIQNSQRPPVPARLDLVQLPWVVWDHWQNPIARGRTTASNLDPALNDEPDRSRVDPAPSTFWHRPVSISEADLYSGFGRTELPVLEDKLWEYDGPKTGYGSNPGFEVKSGDLKAKVKFAETTSEPFTARVFAALGYHVEPTDHVERLNVKYDRRIFREFHLRKEIQMRCMLFGCVPVYTIRLQRRFDPFDFIAWAVLNDGSRWTGAELRVRLLSKPTRKHPEDLPDNFRPEVEQQIHHLVTASANVQIKDETLQNIGPWDFAGLSHEHRRELRGAGLLAAWLGWFDSRFENTRLKIRQTEGTGELRHYFSDLGGGLGRGTGIFSPRGELPNQFDWTFTRGTKPSHGRASFQIVGFRPIDNTPAFEQMTIDDARWMARLIAQLTEEQIVQGLVASGFDSARVRLYTEKLISRRDQAIRDLGLEHEIALLRPNGVDRTLSYDPAANGPVMIRTRSGERRAAKSMDVAVAKGRIVAK